MRTHTISHVKDIDGLSAAALSLAANGGTFALTDYDELFEKLDSVPAGTARLVVCDLGTDASRFEEFAVRLRALSGRMEVTYIDHHYLTDEQRERLGGLGARVVHDPTECAGMLTYLHFRDALPEEAKALSLYAAVTDYMDDSKNARTTMERYDRHYILLESTLLSYALAARGKDPEYPRMLVRELSRMRPPHGIAGVPEAAVEQAAAIARLARKVQKEGRALEHLAYMKTSQGSTGSVAKLLLGAFPVDVGVAYKVKRGTGRAELSIRSTSGCKVHLGKTIGPIAARHGGSGGGHQKAAGGSVSAADLQGVLEELDAALA